jgi:hypothetical protein
MLAGRELPVMSRCSTKSNDQTQDYQSHYDAYFDTREPEFQFAKYPDPEVIDNDDQKEQNGNPYTRVHFVTGHPVPTVLIFEKKEAYCMTRAAAVSLVLLVVRCKV